MERVVVNLWILVVVKEVDCIYCGPTVNLV